MSTAEKTDVGHIDTKSLEKGEFPVVDSPDYRIFLSVAGHEKVLAHAKESLKAEICGILVGHAKRDRQGPYLEIVDVIRGEHAGSQGAQVTFTHETWDHINKEMDTRFSKFHTVGWYHSHPGFGIFLSSLDQFIHQSYFTAATQVALVVDPLSAEEGFFVWKKGQLVPARAWWVGNRLQVFDAKPRDEAPPPAKETRKEGAGTADPPAAPPSLWGELMLTLLALAAGAFLGLWMGEKSGQAHEQQVLVDEMHDLVRLQVLRVGLESDLGVLKAQLAGVQSKLGPAAEGKELKPEDGKASLELLAKVQDEISQIDGRYASIEASATHVLEHEGRDVHTFADDLDRTKGQLREVRRLTALILLDRAIQDLAKGHKDEAQAWVDRAKGSWPEGKEDIMKALPPELGGPEKK